ncbi:hypothetical protein [Dyella sp.]|uniref:hypothetical protein n=1 Tax=Dyella sp. TaxID=1869338 RepID=UPI002D766B78|nr:hypothetical protein [Dyella sp.]HET7331520.1 hypothetical protein [Dyella sp.]
MHVIHDGIEWLEIEHTFSRFKVIPRQITHAHDGKAGLFHTGNVLMDLLWRAVNRLIACSYEQLAGAWPIVLTCRGPGARRCATREAKACQRRHDGCGFHEHLGFRDATEELDLFSWRKKKSQHRPSALRAARASRDSNAGWMGRLRIFYEGLPKSSALGKYMLGIGKNRNGRL